MADQAQPKRARAESEARNTRRLERLTVVLAAFVCLFNVLLLRDVSDRALWTSQIIAPPLPESVGKRGAALLLTVTDEEGKPASGVVVRVFAIVAGEAYLASHASTDPDGLARLDKLPTGEVWVIAERKGLARSSSRLVLEDGERKLALTLHKANRFEVVVVDPSQRPIRGVTVTLYGSDPLPYRAATDSRGLAGFDGLGPPPYAVDVTATGFDSKFIAKLALEDSPLFVKLERLGGLQVVVVDGEGKPVDGATVMVAGSSLWPARSATTSSGGTVSIAGLARGFYDIRAEKDSRVSDTQAGVLLERGEHKRVELTLIEGAFVTVTVTDGEGDDAKPLPNADVALVEQGISSFPRYGRTGKEGQVRLGPVVGSDATVSARADGFVPKSAVALEEGQSEITLALVRGAKVVGRVVDERDFPVDGVRLEIIGVDLGGMPIMESSAITGFRQDHFAFALPGATPLIPAGELGVMPVVPDVPSDLGPLIVMPSEGDDGGSWVSASDGTFELTPVTPGRVRVVARHPNYIETISEPIDLAAGGSAEITIVMKKGGVLEGRVLELDRSPVPGARIEVASESGSADRVTYAAEDGSFAFAALPAEVILSVARPEAPEQIVERMIIDVPPDERREVEIILPRKREPVAFRVLDERGYPLDRAEIHVSSLEYSEPLVKTMFTDDAGDAELGQARGLPLRVVVSRRGKAPLVDQIERAPAVVELTLFEPLTATGIVETRWGNVESANITLLTPTDTKKTHSDAEGNFSFDDLAPSEARLLIEAPGHVTLVEDVIIEGDGRRPVDLGRFELEQAGGVKGVVVDDQGEPIAGVRVAAGRVPTYLPLGELPSGVALTNGRGEFTLDGLPPGQTDIEAYKVGFGREGVDGVRVRAGDVNSTVEITLYDDPEVDITDVSTRGSLAVTLSEGWEGGRHTIVFEHVPISGEASRAGILPGDRLIAFNGLTVRSLEQARRLLNGPLSEDFVLELGRDDDMQWRVRVRRERLRR